VCCTSNAHCSRRSRTGRARPSPRWVTTKSRSRAGTRPLSQGNPVEVLGGRAGTGKTFTLAAIAQAYQRAGYHPVGVAPSACAASELADGTGLATFTVPRCHPAITKQPLHRRSVVIVYTDPTAI